ncbi:MAG: thermonuclease family protein [Rhizobiales bacterium]|nr:thermonuclease family protein [Hyphomicrobiales bacterium]
MRRAKSFLLWLVIIAVLAVIGHFMSRRSPGDPITGTARVMDGDSLLIGSTRVRLHGIDAPERDQECKDANGKTYSCGRTATRALANAIARRSVTCEPVAVDRYDRDVAICRVNDVDLAETMVRGGYAVDYFSRGRYEDAEREARNARRGLWAGEFQAPSSWRRTRCTALH